MTSNLRMRGYQVLEAADGAAALRLGRANASDLALAMLDMRLPDMSGIDLCRELRMFYSGPVVIMSADTAERGPAKALAAGAHEFITKPFGVGDLLDCVHRHTSNPRRTPPAGPLTPGKTSAPA
jgi:two-component system KDP operon response regulator KdpE